MKLNVAERVALLQILPAEGDFTTLKVLRELQEKIGFSEEDHKKYNIRRIGNNIRWGPWNEEEIKEVGDGDKARAKQMEKENVGLAKTMGETDEIEFGEKATEIVKESLLGLDKEKKLKSEHVTLYEKFVQEKKENKKGD